MTNDHHIDQTFGLWLRGHRTRVGLSRVQAAELTHIPCERIIEIETGQSRGISRREAYRLGKILMLDMRETLVRAAGEW